MEERIELLILRANMEDRPDDIVALDKPHILIDDKTSLAAIVALGCAHAVATHGDRQRAIQLLERALMNSSPGSIRVAAVSAIEHAGRLDLARGYMQRFLDEAKETWELHYWKHLLDSSTS